MGERSGHVTKKHDLTMAEVRSHGALLTNEEVHRLMQESNNRMIETMNYALNPPTNVVRRWYSVLECIRSMIYFLLTRKPEIKELVKNLFVVYNEAKHRESPTDVHVNRFYLEIERDALNDIHKLLGFTLDTYGYRFRLAGETKVDFDIIVKEIQEKWKHDKRWLQFAPKETWESIKERSEKRSKIYKIMKGNMHVGKVSQQQMLALFNSLEQREQEITEIEKLARYDTGGGFEIE